MIWVLLYFLIGGLISMLIDAVIDRKKLQGSNSRSAKLLVDLFIICVWPAFVILFIRSTMESIRDSKKKGDSE